MNCATVQHAKLRGMSCRNLHKQIAPLYIQHSRRRNLNMRPMNNKLRSFGSALTCMHKQLSCWLSFKTFVQVALAKCDDDDKREGLQESFDDVTRSLIDIVEVSIAASDHNHHHVISFSRGMHTLTYHTMSVLQAFTVCAWHWLYFLCMPVCICDREA
jgi:hypothetical protein